MERFAPKSNSGFVPRFARRTPSHKRTPGARGSFTHNSTPARTDTFKRSGKQFTSSHDVKPVHTKTISTPATSFKATRAPKVTTKVLGPSPIPKKDPNEFPMRINKYLALKGYTTRRGADDMIAKKRVTINGRFAQLGDKVEATDAIEVRNHKKPDEYVYYAYNKPRGISTEETRKGTKSIAQSISLRGVFAVGNLDTNAQGLVLLTNDKRIIDRLLGPHRDHPKEYIVRTITPLRANFKEKMEQGVTVGNGTIARGHVSIIDNHLFRLTVSDNGAHIRHMCATLFAEIEQITRISILTIEMGRLESNAFRRIDGEELNQFLGALGL